MYRVNARLYITTYVILSFCLGAADELLTNTVDRHQSERGFRDFNGLLYRIYSFSVTSGWLERHPRATARWSGGMMPRSLEGGVG